MMNRKLRLCALAAFLLCLLMAGCAWRPPIPTA